jgi:cyclic nucleotide gated channel
MYPNINHFTFNSILEFFLTAEPNIFVIHVPLSEWAISQSLCDSVRGILEFDIFCKLFSFISRLDELESRLASSSDAEVKTRRFSIDKLSHDGVHGSSKTSSRSFKRGIRKGSEGLKSIGRSLGFGVSKAVFPEDLQVSENKIFDPQDNFLLFWNKLFVISCILAVSVDPLFFYLPVINDSLRCLGIDRNLAIIVTTLRTFIDAFYLIHMALQFRTAYIAPSSRVFGRGELVIDPAQIAKRYLRRYFIIDFLSVLPLPQVKKHFFLHHERSISILTADTYGVFFFFLLSLIFFSLIC